MSVLDLALATWPDVSAGCTAQSIALLPIGAVEAHGPHLPLSTDRIIAAAMARAGAQRLDRAGWTVLILPALDYTAAPFAAEFPGTVSLRPETVRAVIVDCARAVASWGVPWLAIANAHLDPTHLGAVRAAAAEIEGEGRPRIVFPDVTRKPWALRLGAEFKSGACHAGRYESSIVLAEQPDLVRDGVRRELPPNPASLSAAIREGCTSFRQAGGPQAYFGFPAQAGAEEGRALVAALGEILAEAVIAEAGSFPDSVRS